MNTGRPNTFSHRLHLQSGKVHNSFFHTSLPVEIATRGFRPRSYTIFPWRVPHETSSLPPVTMPARGETTSRHISIHINVLSRVKRPR